MSTKVTINIVTALPPTFTPSTMYFVKGGPDGLMDIYLSTSDGSAVRNIISRTQISDLITNAVNGATGVSDVLIAADITARDALVVSGNKMVMVLDASGDVAVGAGSALYVYDGGATTYRLVPQGTGGGGSGGPVNWGDIIGRPVSSPASIDAAVDSSHAHGNIDTLNKFSEDANGDPLYNGNPIGGGIAMVVEW